MLFEEAITDAGQFNDSRANPQTSQSPNTGDSKLFTETNGMANHRKKGCVSFYDGSTLSLTATEWQTMLNTVSKRQIYFAPSTP